MQPNNSASPNVMSDMKMNKKSCEQNKKLKEERKIFYS